MDGWEQEIDKRMTLDSLLALISRIYTRKIMLDVSPQPCTRNPKPHLGLWTQNHTQDYGQNHNPETPSPYTRNPQHETRNPKPSHESTPARSCSMYHTRNPKLKTRNPKPETRNLKPEIRNPKPKTRNPKPETRNHTGQNHNPETPSPDTRNPQPQTRNPKPSHESTPARSCSMHHTRTPKPET